MSTKRKTKAKSKRRSRFRFSLLGIKKGAKLRSVFDSTIIVTVADDKHVTFRGAKTTLTGAAKVLAAEKGKNWPSIQGPMYFTHKGEKLAQLRR